MEYAAYLLLIIYSIMTVTILLFLLLQKAEKIFESITHLEVPTSVCKIRLDRFSPNYNFSSRYGFKDVRPLPCYKHIYPFTEEALSNICYFFDFDYADGRNPRDYIMDIAHFWLNWAEIKNPGDLFHYSYDDGAGLIRDTRFNCRVSQLRLDIFQNVIYSICDQPRNLPTIV